MTEIRVENQGDIAVCIRNKERYPVAFGSLNSATGEILGLYVDPAYRRKGYAKEIIGVLLQKAKELGLFEAYMTSRKDNEEANNLAKTLGFDQWNKWIKFLKEK